MKESSKFLAFGFAIFLAVFGVLTAGYYLRGVFSPSTNENVAEPAEGTVSQFTFYGDTLTGYIGTDNVITLPTSYSLSDVVEEKIEFQDREELEEYLMNKEMSLPSFEEQEAMYPVRLYKKSGDEVEYDKRSSLKEILTDEDYPVSIVEKTQQFLVGNDIEVKKVGDSAFERKGHSFVKIIIPEGYESIGSGAFFDLVDLEEIEFPHSLKEIGRAAFGGCDSLTSLILPEGLEKIDGRPFSDCDNLKSIILPSTLKTISTAVFYNMPALEKIFIPDYKNLAIARCMSSSTLFEFSFMDFNSSTCKLKIYCASTSHPAWATFNDGDLFRVYYSKNGAQYWSVPVVYGATLEQFNAA